MNPRLTSFLVLMCVMGCAVEDAAPRIAAVHPQPVAQRERLVIYGAHFGPADPGHHVLIGSTCATIHFWEEDAIGITVPSGVGVGERNLSIHWNEGGTISTGVEVNGQDYAADPEQTCAPGLVREDEVEP